MPTRLFFRRLALSAAISSPLTLTAVAAVHGADSATAIQRVQYQPGQPAPPNSGVTQELQKMFEESGQPMPSMRPQDLPNAQGQQAHLAQPKTSAAQVSASGSTAAGAKAAAPAKRNFLQKFSDSITGNDKRRKAAESQVVPPVPPGYQESAKSAQAPRGNQTQPRTNANAANTPQPRTAQPGAVANGARTANATPQPNTRRTNQPAQPVPAVPKSTAANASPRNTVAQKSATPTEQSKPTAAKSANPNFVQPGAAPGFMPSQTGTRQVATASSGSGHAAKSRTMNVLTGEPPAAPPVDDSFVDPFNESPLIDNETLDLDALAKVRSPAAEAVNDAAAFANAESSRQPEDAGLELPTADEFAAAASESLASTPDAENADAPAADVVEVNPFTDVRLTESDDTTSAVPATTPAATDPVADMFAADDARDAALAGNDPDAALPMNDFNRELPAISLPTVADEAGATITETPVPAPVELSIPSSEPSSVSTTESSLSIPALTLPIAEASTPADLTLPTTNDVQLSAPEPLQSVDAERLQQAAEQERRLQQQRLILSRTGQAGFKGFCPVALRDRRELIDTRPEFTAAFGLQTYTFSSLEARLAFESDPARYAPAAGGSDVVQLVNTGEERPGTLDYALWHRDRLYLFQSRETMTAFSREPQRFASQY